MEAVLQRPGEGLCRISVAVISYPGDEMGGGGGKRYLNHVILYKTTTTCDYEQDERIYTEISVNSPALLKNATAECP